MIVVAPLEWTPLPLGGGYCLDLVTGRLLLRARADTPFRSILVLVDPSGSGWYRWGPWGEDIGPHADEDAAKVAAHADFADRVLSVIVERNVGRSPPGETEAWRENYLLRG